MQAKQEKKIFPPHLDKILLIITIALTLIGIIVITTAGIIVAHKRFTTPSADPYDYFFLHKQLISAFIGLIALLSTANIDYHFWNRISLLALIFNIILLLLVFTPFLGGKEVYGARRWLRLGFLSLQPSEFLKLTLGFYLASWLSSKGKDIRNLKYGLLPFLLLVGIIVLILEKQSDLGTTIVIGATSVVVYFVSGASLLQLSLSAILALCTIYYLVKTTPYRMLRFSTFLNPFSDPQKTGYHIVQALLALGSGGFWGIGFGKSRQKYLYLPEPATDSIFAIIGEEFGFIGTTFIIALYFLLALRAFKIAENAPDKFGKLLATFLAFWIPFQAIINIGSMINLIPLTGITLPFISYGGTSLLISLTSIGILLNISKQNQRAQSENKPYINNRRRHGRSFISRSFSC